MKDDKQKKKANTVVLPPEVIALLHARKAQTGQTITYLVAEAVKLYLGAK